jgi:hypothetical protein
MEMRIVVPDTAGATALAEWLTHMLARWVPTETRY